MANEVSRLDGLATEIRREVAAADADFRSAVGHAIRAGELLREAKGAVAHGGWLPWLKANFNGSVRTAQNYMRLADNVEEAQRVAHLGLKGALKELAAPKPELKPSLAELAEQLREEDLPKLRNGILTLSEAGAHTALGYSSWRAFIEAEFVIPADMPDEVVETILNMIGEHEGGPMLEVRPGVEEE